MRVVGLAINVGEGEGPAIRADDDESNHRDRDRAPQRWIAGRGQPNRGRPSAPAAARMRQERIDRQLIADRFDPR